MYYLNARYYDAANGCFTQRDTYLGELHVPASRNLYTYAAGNPIYYTDPTGHFGETFFDVVSFGFSLYEAIKEPTVGNIAAAVFDAASIFVPFIAGTGLAKAGMKTVDAADDIYDAYKAVDRTVDTIDAVVDIGKTADKVHDALKISNAVDNASDIVNSAKRGSKVIDKVTTTTGKLSKYGDDAAAAAKKAQQAKNAANKANLAKSTKKINISSADKRALTGNVTVKQKGWHVGDPIDIKTRAGNDPSWSTVRQRYWKNEALNNPAQYSSNNVNRMKKGLAPIGEDNVSMELHHPFGREGANFYIFEPLTQTAHRLYHYGGY